MKKLLLGIIMGLALGGSAVWLYQKQHAATDAKTEEKKPEEKKEESLVHHGTNGETFLKLDRETQNRMGLKTAPLAAAQLKAEVKGYGRVLDPAPLAAVLTDVATADAAVAASKKELQRTKHLFEQGQNSSQRALDAAETAMRREEIALGGARMKVMAGWGETFMPGPKLVPMLESLVSRQSALVRVDLPLAESLKAAPTGGRLAALTAPNDLAEAEFLGPAPNADSQMQGQGFLFLQKVNPLPAGAAVVAWLTVPGDAETGVTVPREALLRHEGEVFVYLQTSDDSFARKEIELDRPTGAGWFVREGLKAQDKVVIVGAQQLLSEELKGQGGG